MGDIISSVIRINTDFMEKTNKKQSFAEFAEDLYKRRFVSEVIGREDIIRQIVNFLNIDSKTISVATGTPLNRVHRLINGTTTKRKYQAPLVDYFFEVVEEREGDKALEGKTKDYIKGAVFNIKRVPIEKVSPEAKIKLFKIISDNKKKFTDVVSDKDARRMGNSL